MLQCREYLFIPGFIPAYMERKYVVTSGKRITGAEKSIASRASADPGNLVSVVIVGDEILDGHTLDTNSNWLSRRLTGAGYLVRERLVVRDDIDDIRRALDFCLSRSPHPAHAIFLCGGIGPTPDDITFEAVACYLGVPLEENAEALANMEMRYRSVNEGLPPGKKVRLNEAARKMARVPRGAILLENMEGTAPGLMFAMKGGTKLFVLPGVPGELQWIVEHSVMDTHLEKMVPRHVEEIIFHGREASLAPLLGRFGMDHPGLSVGSYPQDHRHIIIRLTGEHETVMKASEKLKDMLDEMESDDPAPPRSEKVRENL